MLGYKQRNARESNCDEPTKLPQEPRIGRGKCVDLPVLLHYHAQSIMHKITVGISFRLIRQMSSVAYNHRIPTGYSRLTVNVPTRSSSMFSNMLCQHTHRQTFSYIGHIEATDVSRHESWLLTNSGKAESVWMFACIENNFEIKTIFIITIIFYEYFLTV